ncbi:hypothetical protein [Streptomyces phaeochromogenes]|uniref:hypothetical protein n=1 Tax=Streptomyces phaeochromogenes TaxID=1923 RepID=UPI003714C051
MSEPKQIRMESVHYAEALRDAVEPYLKGGGTQTAIAAATHIANGTLTRYLKGERTAPPAFLTALQVFLTGQGHPLAAEQITRLEFWCGQAHQASESPSVQLRHLQEELARVRAATKVTTQELNLLEARSQRLEDELSEALAHAKAVERERDELAETAGRQQLQLEAAQSYNRATAAELQRQQEENQLLRREVEVLRSQNRALLTESTSATTSSADAIAAVSTQVSDPGAAATRSARQRKAPVRNHRRPRHGPDGIFAGPRPQPAPAPAAVPSEPVEPSEWSTRVRKCRTSGQLTAQLRSLWRRTDRMLPAAIERDLIHALRTRPALPSRAPAKSLGENTLRQRGATEAEIEDFKESFRWIATHSRPHPRNATLSLAASFKDRSCSPDALGSFFLMGATGYTCFWVGTTSIPSLFFANAFEPSPSLSALALILLAVGALTGWVFILVTLDRWAGIPRLLKFIHWALVTAVLVLPWLPVTKNWPLWFPALLHALRGL